MSKRLIHLMRIGHSVPLAGGTTLATWCGRAVKGDDVNHHAYDQVTCSVCKKRYEQAKAKA